MRYLVTGGGGFIGANIVERLIESGHEVRVLDNFATGRRENLASLLGRFDLIEGDIRDYWTVEEAVRGVDYVLHQAALPSVPRSVKNPLTSNEVNINGTLNVLAAARQAKVKKVVLASSSSVYGDANVSKKNESLPLSPLSPYAVTKAAGEQYGRLFWELYGVPTVSLRYFNVFGPRQNPEGDYAAVIPKFIRAVLTHQVPVVYGDGGQSRDFTYIENVVRANLLAVTNPEIIGISLNAACGTTFSLNHLLKEVCRIVGTSVEAEYGDPRPGDVRHSCADISLFRKFGYEPAVSFGEGLRRTIEYFRVQLDK